MILKSVKKSFAQTELNYCMCAQLNKHLLIIIIYMMMSSAELLASKLILRVILSDQWLMCLLISISIITNQKDPFQAVSKFLMLKLIIIKGPPDFAYFLILYLSLYIVLSFSSSIWGCFTLYIYIYIYIYM